MNGGFDLYEEVAAGVRDTDGAWRFIRRFANHYARPIIAGDGCGDDELREAQARLGFSLPASLRDVYALIGRRDDLTRNQDRMLTPEQLHIDDTGQVLVFRVENQAVAQWGIPISRLTEPDPPVVFQLQSAPSAEWVWRPFLDRVSLAGVEMVLSEWMLSGDIADNRELDDEALRSLDKTFRRLPMPDYPLWAEPDGRPTRWFSAPEAILRDDAGLWLWVRAATPEARAAVRHALPGEWMMHES
ncbi:hypothetical protein GCM10010399_18120 [Dactylosporangium fulvum]|uniref:Knr4/Smi1-like domain-containing protein n=1 Tax=Dactylosporangium fulvum TaxID=53359 RepID=A0ABY5VRI8_9ACTN|nr:hypothetical protein [Dactylosporangium fulvum]UWP80363.1 hypothetical protein Dfulv_35105 [Dactylosporangium fulvum]